MERSMLYMITDGRKNGNIWIKEPVKLSNTDEAVWLKKDNAKDIL